MTPAPSDLPLAFPVGSPAKPSRRTIWLISEPKRALLATFFVVFLNGENNFLLKNKQGTDTIKFMATHAKNTRIHFG